MNVTLSGRVVTHMTHKEIGDQVIHGSFVSIGGPLLEGRCMWVAPRSSLGLGKVVAVDSYACVGWSQAIFPGTTSITTLKWSHDKEVTNRLLYYFFFFEEINSSIKNICYGCSVFGGLTAYLMMPLSSSFAGCICQTRPTEKLTPMLSWAPSENLLSEN